MSYYSRRRTRKIFIGILLGLLIVVFLFGILFAEKALELRQQNLQNNKNTLQAELAEAKDYVRDLYIRGQAYLDENMPGIVCWGDSLTSGMGGQKTNYPTELEYSIGKKFSEALNIEGKVNPDYKYLVTSKEYELSVNVDNMGAAGDTSDTILGRAGVVPFVISDEITIPEGRTRVSLKLESESGDSVAPLRYTSAGMESVTIAGVSGKIEISQSSPTSPNYVYYFTRNVEGSSVIVPEGTPVETSGSIAYKSHIPIVMIGATGGWDTSYELVKENMEMVKGYDKYIILGIPTGTKASRGTLETLMKETFGDKYINLREYFCTDALTDAGITPTKEDLKNIEEGTVPLSFRAAKDNDHLNDTGYQILANLVYERMEELGYFDTVIDSLESLK